MTKILSYSEVCEQPYHLRIYQFPVELEELGFQKLKVANEHWAHFVRGFGSDGPDSAVLLDKLVIKICYAPDFYGEIRYPDNVVVEQTITLTCEEFERFKHLVSLEYKTELKDKADREHQMDIETFRSLISPDEFRELVVEWTTDYITDLFGEYVDIFNIRKLAESAEEDIIESIYLYYEQFVDLDDKERQKVKRWIIDEEGIDSAVDKEDEHFVSDMSDIMCGLAYKLFYDHYPFLKLFADEVAGLTKGDYPNGDCMGGKVEETNRVYNGKLLNYAWTMLDSHE